MQPRKWTKRDGGQGVTYQFVGETQNDKYPKTIHFSVYGDDRYNSMQLVEGAVFKVDFDIESKPWKDTYITAVNAWRATRFDQQPAAPTPQAQTYAPNPTPQYAPQPTYQQQNDNVPF